jgi:zinc protease
MEQVRYFGRMKRRTTLPLFLFVLCGLVATGQEYRPTFETFTLSNGLSVVLQRDTTLPLVALNMAYRGGSSRDAKGKTGIANIAGEMLLTGTRQVPREELLRLKEEEGVSISAHTSVDWLNIASVFPASLLEEAVTIEADRMKNAEQSINVEIFNAITGILRKEHTRRSQKALGDFTQQIYNEIYVEGHPYRHSTLGTATDLDTLTVEDVRTFMQRYYTPSNASLTVSGRFDTEKLRALITRKFDAIPAGIVSRWKNIPDTFTPIGQGAFIREDRMEYNMMHIVFPTVHYGHEDDAALHMLAKALNGSRHAILQKGMVEANPAVLRAEAYQSSQEIAGNFWITVVVKPEAKLQPLFGQVSQLLASIAADGLTEEEIIGARNQAAMEFYQTQEAYYGQGGRGDLLNLGMLYGNTPLFSYLQFERQQIVTSADIQRVVRRYLSKNNQLVVSAVPMGKREYAVQP